MSEVTGTAPGATPAPAAPTAPSGQSRLADAAKALAGGGEPPAKPTAPPLPSTPDAPATAAVLAAEESASQLIRMRLQVADQQKALKAERDTWEAEQRSKTAAQQERLTRAEESERRWAEFERDPHGFIAAIQGKRTPGEIARDIYIDSVDLATLPPEQQASVKHEREQRAMRREIEQFKTAAAAAEEKRSAAEAAALAQRNLSDYRTRLSGELLTIDDTTPNVKRMVAKNPQRALKTLWDVANLLAGPGKPVLDAKGLAQQLEPALTAELEAEMDDWREVFEQRFGAPPAASTPPPSPPPAAHEPRHEPRALSSAVTDATPLTRTRPSSDERTAAAIRALGGQHN